MSIQRVRPALVAGMMLAALLATPGHGAEYGGEVRSCVNAVNNRLDLDDVDRVRHFVNVVKRTGIGRVLEIETAVIADDAHRYFSSYCVAKGSAAPVRFRISEVQL